MVYRVGGGFGAGFSLGPFSQLKSFLDCRLSTYTATEKVPTKTITNYEYRKLFERNVATFGSKSFQAKILSVLPAGSSAEKGRLM